jgi:hypothetical protein
MYIKKNLHSNANENLQTACGAFCALDDKNKHKLQHGAMLVGEIKMILKFR